ncbi:hypothetical protein B0H10DRAFT_2159917 [Mycena sp. CBHHK59/15]|nr:hypothetical protein B0H10DRAFT_2159917 [Mycena sp. CBHHK59/15]
MGPAAPDEAPSKVAKTEESRSATDAAATAAAIAAKIAAQFTGGSFPPAMGLPRDIYDGEFTFDIDINDQRNRYLLTKGSTQEQILEETGAAVSTKGVWYPDRSRATEKDPALYLHVSAHTKETMQAAIDKVHELIAIDMGSLRKWPEEKLPVGLESIRNFNVRAKVVGPSGSFVKYIQSETQTRVQIKGIGSGFIDQETNQEEPTPLYIHITGPEEGQVARAKALTDDLLVVVRQEHAKVKVVVTQVQMELHYAQQQHAAYSAYGGYAPPAPSDAPPPPPPGGAPPDAAAAGPPPATDIAAYSAYWLVFPPKAAYGYDVNSPEFKEWQASQEQQYAQYYASQGYDPAAYTAATTGGDAPPPPPADPAPPPPPT